MKLKVTFEINGKVFPSYFQSEQTAYEEVSRKLKYGWKVLEIVRLSW
jgi:hypothetical protein